MNGKSNLLVILLLLSSMSPGYAGSTEKNYKKLVVLGVGQRIEGRYEVADNQALMTNIYRFSYDTDGRVASIQYLRDGMPASDHAFGVSQIVFTYAINQETRLFEDASGRISRNSDGVCAQRFDFDSTGHLLSILNYDAAGQNCEDNSGVASWIYSVGENIDSVSCEMFKRDGTRVGNEILEYDTSGNLIEINLKGIVSDQKSALPLYIRYGYDGLENLTRRAYMDPRGRLTSPPMSIWDYDRWAQIYTPLSSAELRDARTTWAYDGNGNMTEEYDFGTDSLPSGKGLYAYDGAGNLKKVAYYDGKGKMTRAVGDWG